MLYNPCRWLVTIQYREPEFELRTHVRRQPFEGQYEVAADDCLVAVETALGQFRERELTSNVGWTRLVVGLRCEILT